MLESKSDPTHKRSGSNGVHCGRTAVIHPVHGYNHMRRPGPFTVFFQAGGIPLDGGILHGFKWHISKDKGASRVCGWFDAPASRKRERLAFAFANALAKRDISRAIAHPLVP